MSSQKQKLRLTCAFAALATLALAVSCRGFFVNPTLTSIAISPTAPQVEQGQTVTLQAFGTYDDGSRNQIRSGVSWSSDTPAVAAVNPSTGILSGVSTGTATITASAQALSSTATATVFIVIDSIVINPTSASVKAGSTQNFTVNASSNGATLNLTSSATLTAELNGTATSTITCAYNGTNAQVCTTTSGTTLAGTYQIVASYSGSTLTATATLTVN
ncbi:MAG TPA: Ig-like domain-containing protein [Candidatus Acidoferrum sp.]|nr:Ig-like domain-containing protein [Candidatus Acidoferrum sp.]